MPNPMCMYVMEDRLVEPICRFCHIKYEDERDPFISPCECTGSVEFVHQNCLRAWRRTTEYPEHRQYCQLCLTEYDIERRWPLETIPEDDRTGAWFFLSKPYIFILILQFIYSSLLQLITNTLSIHLNRVSAGLLYVAIINSLSLIYITYYYKYFKSVQSKHVYLYYWSTCKLRDESYIRPCYLFLASSISYICIYFCPEPYGMMFIILLPQYYHCHKGILELMNDDGEIND